MKILTYFNELYYKNILFELCKIMSRTSLKTCLTEKQFNEYHFDTCLLVNKIIAPRRDNLQRCKVNIKTKHRELNDLLF